MSTEISVLPDSPSSETVVPVARPVVVDTTSGSPLHALARSAAIKPFGMTRTYVVTVLVTYVPLVLAALLGPTSAFVSAGGVKLPFFQDWNIAWLLLVSFPSLVIFTLADHRTLTAALLRIQQDGIVSMNESDGEEFAPRWKQRFREVNIIAYAVGCVVAIVVTWLNYIVYGDPSVGYWIVANGALQPAGYVFLYCIFLFYAVIPIYVFRNIATAVLLKDLVSRSRIAMLPFHPDKCGGLRPIGRLGLRNQYLLTIIGINIVTLFTVSIRLSMPVSLRDLIIAAAIAYVILGPIVFMAPLLSFRTGMLRAKSELMSEVAQRLRLELGRLRKQLPSGAISKSDEELIDRLRKLGSVIDELPVWPFDAGTLRKFLSAYVVPLAGAIAYPLIKLIVSAIAEEFGVPAKVP